MGKENRRKQRLGFNPKGKAGQVSSFSFGICIFFINLFTLVLHGQGENTKWYFSQQLGMDFIAGEPSLLTDGAMNSLIESSSTLSDGSGDLLFYSDGLSVWNRNHQILSNGSNLSGHFSTAQSPHFVQWAESDSIFLLYSNTSDGTLYYSIIDQSLDNGQGDIIATAKDVPIISNIAEMSKTVPAPCGGFWLITHERLSDRYVVIRFSSTGVEEIRYIPIGDVFMNTIPSNNISSRQGRIAVNRENSMICLTNQSGNIHLLDFDRSTGDLSNLRVLNTEIVNGLRVGAQSPVFSDDGMKLYICEGIEAPLQTSIYQYDLTVDNPVTIQNSKTFMALVDQDMQLFSNLAMGQNGKIYVTRRRRSFLGVINNPNQPGLLANYVSDGFSLGGVLKDNHSLQNQSIIAESALDFPSVFPKDTIVCHSNELQLDLQHPEVQLLWENDSSSIMITESGVYSYTLVNESCLYLDSLIVSINDLTIDLGNDTTICPQATLLLDSGTSGNLEFLWQDDSTRDTFRVESPGTYSLRVTDGTCIAFDSITIMIQDVDENFLGADSISLCQGDSLVFDLISSGATSYTWQDGSSLPVRVLSETGLYFVIADFDGCSAQDSVLLYPALRIELNLGMDQTICQGDQLILDPIIGDANIVWQDGSSNPRYVVESPGLYTAEISDPRYCTTADSILVMEEFCSQFSVYVPNVFSPNNDGVNDLFLITFEPQPPPIFSLDIYDRWGALVFRSENPSESWDGTLKNQILQPGVYTYQMSYRLESGLDEIKTGTCTLLR